MFWLTGGPPRMRAASVASMVSGAMFTVWTWKWRVHVPTGGPRRVRHASIGFPWLSPGLLLEVPE